MVSKTSRMENSIRDWCEKFVQLSLIYRPILTTGVKRQMEHNFRSDILVGNFGVLVKTFYIPFILVFISGLANQNSITIYSPTEISGFFYGKHSLSF